MNNTQPKRCAIYTRVSTGQQDAGNQLRALRRYARAQGWKLTAIYRDVDTGSKPRAQLETMMQAAARRQFDVVIWWSVDRLTREGIAATFRYLERLKAYGVGYVDLQNPIISSTGPEGEITLAIAAILARMERERISARTRAGLARVKANGQRLGRPRRILDVSQIRKLYEQGMTPTDIARRLKVSRQTITRRLNPPSR